MEGITASVREATRDLKPRDREKGVGLTGRGDSLDVKGQERSG